MIIIGPTQSMDIPTIHDNPVYAPLEVASQNHAQAPGKTYYMFAYMHNKLYYIYNA